jgi:hypothetical protein
VSLGVLDLRAEALLRLLRWQSLRHLSRRDVTLTEGGSAIRAPAGAELVTQDVRGLTDPTFAEQRGNTCYLMFASKVFWAVCNDKQLPSNNSDRSYEECAPAPLRVKCPTIRTLGAATGKQSCAEAAAERRQGILV